LRLSSNERKKVQKGKVKEQGLPRVGPTVRLARSQDGGVTVRVTHSTIKHPGDDHFRDVQMLAGHAALSATQRYIEADVEAQRKVVDLI
jgi:hypothetical protein